MPSTIAPASRSRRITKASSGGIEPASITEPAVVGRSWVSMLSLTRIGIPCSGERGPFSLRSRSSARAVSSAFWFSVITAFRVGPVWS
ncbi:MAG: hypothetical protein R2909_00105 [Gemmatimonadales bacterium]